MRIPANVYAAECVANIFCKNFNHISITRNKLFDYLCRKHTRI